MIIGYARVSTADQKLDAQIDALSDVSAERIFSETISGATAKRPELQRMLEGQCALKFGTYHYILLGRVITNDIKWFIIFTKQEGWKMKKKKPSELTSEMIAGMSDTELKETMKNSPPPMICLWRKSVPTPLQNGESSREGTEDSPLTRTCFRDF